MREVLTHSVPQSGNAQDPGNPAQSWRILNFNFAIIATRTQQPELMHAALDLLKQLPDECAAFYEEGVRQAEKKVYAPHVRDIMRQRFANGRPATKTG